MKKAAEAALVEKPTLRVRIFKLAQLATPVRLDDRQELTDTNRADTSL